MSDYRDKLNDLGIDLSKVRGTGGKVLCPKCSHTRKKKKDPCLSVNIEDGWYKCHNCDFSGNVKFTGKGKKKEYSIPNIINQTDLHESVVDFFHTRGIGQTALIRAGVKNGFTWMPQTQKEEFCIQFNYTRGGQVVNIKHRAHPKHFRLEKDAELIFYGLDDLKEDSDYIVIVEGEIDKLSWEHVGETQVLSVPNGASLKSNASLEYLDNCWDYFDNDKKVILAVDNDEAGMILREELSRRIGKDRCYKVDFRDQKDSNDYLQRYGGDELLKVIKEENLIEYPMQGVVEIDDVWDRVEYIMDNGLKRGIVTTIFPEFDNLMSFDGSKLCIVTGIPNSGKSPFVDMIMICLSILYGWKWGVCSMENKPIEVYIVKLAEKIYGRFIRPNRPLPKDQKERIREFIREHFFFIEANDENNESDTLEFILNSAKDLVRRKGIKGLVIDPWNKIEHQMTPGETETAYISRALDSIIKFERAHDLFTFLIAHPAKPKKTKGGEYEVPDLYSVAGSANFYNKPDWGITIHRNYGSGLTEAHVNKVKWDHLGKIGRVALKYNGGNGRLGDITKDFDFSNWLDSLQGVSDNNDVVYEDFDYETTVFNDGGSLPEDAPF